MSPCGMRAEQEGIGRPPMALGNDLWGGRRTDFLGCMSYMHQQIAVATTIV